MSPSSEAELRYPSERIVFVLFAVLNLAILVVTAWMATRGAEWLSQHPFFSTHVKELRAIAIAAVSAVPASIFIRNGRRALVLGGSIRASPTQFPVVYSVFAAHCAALEMDPPELYISDEVIKETCRGFSTFKRHYVVLKTAFLEPDLDKTRVIFSFELARELGRIRVGHTVWWDEQLISYVSQIPYLRNVLAHLRNFTYDRYGAWLVPDGLPGLVAHASGRRMLPCVDLRSYLSDLGGYGGFWVGLASLSNETPPLAARIRKLYEAGLFDFESDLRRFKKEPQNA